MMRIGFWLVLASVILTPLNGCSSHGTPYLEVQACIGNDGTFASAFPALISAVSARYDLSFVDRSVETQRQLEDINGSKNIKKSVVQTINFGLFQKGRVKVMVGNLGLSRHEVLISFFGDARDKADLDLSGDVVRILKQRWPVEIVPAGRGAFPIVSCKIGAHGGGKSPNASGKIRTG